MKRFAACIILVIIACSSALTQAPCLPEGITFSTQSQIDSFQFNYPDCTGIEGSVNILGEDITNLDGLIGITSVGGDLNIGKYEWWLPQGNPNLMGLVGLSNLTSIGGSLRIGDNDALASLAGLGSLVSIAGELGIYYNDALTSLTGLEALTSIGDDLRISFNQITSLTGLEGLAFLGDTLYIGGNDLLTSLSGLEGLTSIDGNLFIHANNALTSLMGLSFLDSVGENFQVLSNSHLSSFTGVDSLSYIGGRLIIKTNAALSSLEGLGDLDAIGSDLRIEGNAALKSLDGLEGLNTIGGWLIVEYNDALNSLSGIANLDPGSILHLSLMNNQLLSECNIQVICDYLEASYGTVNIHTNASGCNSQSEVEEACDNEGYGEAAKPVSFIIHPNPSGKDFITLTSNSPHIFTHLKCFNTFGQQVYRQEIFHTETMIQVGNLAPGIYLLVVYGEGRPLGWSKFVVR